MGEEILIRILLLLLLLLLLKFFSSISVNLFLYVLGMAYGNKKSCIYLPLFEKKKKKHEHNMGRHFFVI
tara:strand:+ start:6257 stop:6463 length:207 start_codon:yes stop_codon:yes gene_type:complete